MIIAALASEDKSRTVERAGIFLRVFVSFGGCKQNHDVKNKILCLSSAVVCRSVGRVFFSEYNKSTNRRLNLLSLCLYLASIELVETKPPYTYLTATTLPKKTKRKKSKNMSYTRSLHEFRWKIEAFTDSASVIFLCCVIIAVWLLPIGGFATFVRALFFCWCWHRLSSLSVIHLRRKWATEFESPRRSKSLVERAAKRAHLLTLVKPNDSRFRQTPTRFLAATTVPCAVAFILAWFVANPLHVASLDDRRFYWRFVSATMALYHFGHWMAFDVANDATADRLFNWITTTTLIVIALVPKSTFIELSIAGTIECIVERMLKGTERLKVSISMHDAYARWCVGSFDDDPCPLAQ